MWCRTRDPKTIKRNTVTKSPDSDPPPLSRGSLTQKLDCHQSWAVFCILSLWQHSGGGKEPQLHGGHCLLCLTSSDIPVHGRMVLLLSIKLGAGFTSLRKGMAERSHRLSAPKEREGENAPELYSSEELRLYFPSCLPPNLSTGQEISPLIISTLPPSTHFQKALPLYVVSGIKPSTNELCLNVPYSNHRKGVLVNFLFTTKKK